MASKKDAERALASKYPLRSTWVEGKVVHDGYRVRAYLGAGAAFCLPALVASSREPFAPAAWATLVRKL